MSHFATDQVSLNLYWRFLCYVKLNPPCFYRRIFDKRSYSISLLIEIKKLIRNNFKNTIIGCGGYDKESAEADLKSGLFDLIGFGRPFINNPDLVTRLEQNQELSQSLNADLFYSADEKGYTDYANYKAPIVRQIEQYKIKNIS